MRRLAVVALVAGALLASTAVEGEAGGKHRHRHHHHHHGVRFFVGFGPSFYWGPWWYHPRPLYVYSPPAVIVQQPPVYVQQAPATVAPAPPAAPPAYWYYCASAQAYYPNVSSCPEEWIKVPPRSEP